MHYYQFNIGDYASHTRGLSLLEDLAYRRLIDEYYLAERSLNGCSTDVARLIGFVQHTQDVEYILKRFFIETDGSWVHERIEKEILEYKNKQEKNVKAGKASAEARKNKGFQANAEQTLNKRSTNVQPTNNQEPRTINHKPTLDIPTGVSQNVWDEFVAHRKTKKAKVTQLVIDGISKEASKAGWILEDALKEIVVMNWQSFKADYVAKRQNYKGYQHFNRQEALEASNRAIAEKFLRDTENEG